MSERTNKIKVMVIDDSALVREAFRSILADDPDIEIVDVAQDPIVASEKLRSISPDVIILDIEMPRMDGISFLRKLMASRPIPVIICSGRVGEGSIVAIQALELGAVELIQKPAIAGDTGDFIKNSHERVHDAIIAAYKSTNYVVSGGRRDSEADDKIVSEEVSLLQREEQHELTSVLIEPDARYVVGKDPERIIAMGASTGGTEIIAEILASLPADAPAIVIIQHIPEYFTAGFVEFLSGICVIKVKEATDGVRMTRGVALVAPGTEHLIVKADDEGYYIELKDGPLVSRHKPSIDVMFRSISLCAGKNAMGVILTGVGNDGAYGLLGMRQVGATTIAQNENTCAVADMPREAIKISAVSQILMPDEIAKALLA